MKKEDGKYIVHLGLKWVNGKIVMPQLKEEKLREEIDAMMPDGFSFKEGVFSSDQPSLGVWEQKKKIGRYTFSYTISCEVTRGHQDYRTPDGNATWYWTYQICIWPSFVDKSLLKCLFACLIKLKKLNTVCHNIAKFIESKYEVKGLTEEDVMTLPERTEPFGGGCGASVTKGELNLDSLFRDEKIYEDHGLNSRTLSVEVKNGKVWMNEGDSGPACRMMNGGESNFYDRDLYGIDLKELMGALECTTLDDFYAEMRKRFGFYDGFNRFGEFLEENKIKFAAYAG